MLQQPDLGQVLTRTGRVASPFSTVVNPKLIAADTPDLAVNPAAKLLNANSSFSKSDIQLLKIANRHSHLQRVRRATRNRSRLIRQLQASQEQLDASEVNAQLAQVASAAYRLLDPRRRIDRLERIELSVLAILESARSHRNKRLLQNQAIEV